jgi:O-succinylbenzoate synthase
MNIRTIELREIRLRLVHFFETSFGRTVERRIMLVRVVDADGAEGWGECTAGEGPFYSEEWIDSAWEVTRLFLAPMVLGQEVEGAGRVGGLMRRPRGNRMAKASVETACWDLEARRAGVPLWRHLGGVRAEIPCGVSIGIQDTPEQLLEKIEKELAAGYQRIKIKIKPGWDVEAVERVRGTFGNIPLQVDANAAYSLDDTDVLARLDPFGLLLIEQPLDYDDVMDHAVLQRRLKTPVCLDESIHTVRIARDAIDARACQIINIKPGRVGGHQASIELHDLCAAHGIPVWHGGMLESGIGRAHNIHLASLPNFTLPGDIAASKRYYEPDLIDPPIDIAKDGTIAVPTSPGIGVNIVRERVDKATLRHVSL